MKSLSFIGILNWEGYEEQVRLMIFQDLHYFLMTKYLERYWQSQVNEPVHHKSQILKPGAGYFFSRDWRNKKVTQCWLLCSRGVGAACRPRGESSQSWRTVGTTAGSHPWGRTVASGTSANNVWFLQETKHFNEMNIRRIFKEKLFIQLTSSSILDLVGQYLYPEYGPRLTRINFLKSPVHVTGHAPDAIIILWPGKAQAERVGHLARSFS